MLSALTIAVILLVGGGYCKDVKRDYDPLHDECAFEPADRLPCGRKHDTLGELGCLVRGCCFDDSRDYPTDVPRCFLAHRMLTPQCNVAYEDKDDCGHYGILEGACLKRGCCWRPSERVNDPDCFHSNPSALIRLMNFDTESDKSGRVEVYHDDKWGTVCDDNFGNTAARVVCRQLGYNDGVAQCCASHGPGNGNIWLDSVSCSGNEESLEECSHDPWGSNDCSPGEDVSVVCYAEGEEVPTTTPNPEYPEYNYNEYNYGSGAYKMKNTKRFNKRNWLNSKRGNGRGRGGFQHVEP